MRSEREIRAHLDAIRFCIAKPCGCAAAGHAFACEMGARLMESHVELIEWVLGDSDDMGRLVEELAAAKARG